MTEEARREWLTVAWATLGHLPPDVLAHGCRKARESCDHPSKIVPAIVAETSDWMKTLQSLSPAPPPIPPERQIERHDEPMTADQIDEANRLFKRLGIKTRFYPDGIDPVQPDSQSTSRRGVG